MPSRFTLPHIEITRFKSQHEYAGVGAGGGSSAVRIREEHGRRLQGELDAALQLAEELRPKDDRLPAPTTSIIEVELRRGTDPEKLDRKTADIRSVPRKPMNVTTGRLPYSCRAARKRSLQRLLTIM
jgi:hypothetical protein